MLNRLRVRLFGHLQRLPASYFDRTPLGDTISRCTADVDTLATYAASNGLAGLHLWSLDRDTPCATTTTYASPTCNSDSGTTPLELSRGLVAFAREAGGADNVTVAVATV